MRIHLFISEHPDIRFTFSNHHSLEAYQYIGNHSYDLALISDDMYYKDVETIPAFREPMVLLTSRPETQPVHPTQLDPSREIRLPWNPEYDTWHDFWFSPNTHPRAVLDQMHLLEEFLSWGDCWTIAPVSVAFSVVEHIPIHICPLEDGPSPRIIYYLRSQHSCQESVNAFLACLKKSLMQYPEIECLFS